LIDPAYLTDPADLEPLVEGLKLAQEIIYSAPFDTYRGKSILPEQRLQNDEQIKRYIRAHGETLYHPVGSCAMGPSNDPMSVVDSDLRVRGVNGLRVVDASASRGCLSDAAGHQWEHCCPDSHDCRKSRRSHPKELIHLDARRQGVTSPHEAGW